MTKQKLDLSLGSRTLTRTIPLIITTVCAIIVIGEYFLTNPQVAAASAYANTTAVMITSVAVFVGFVSWLRRNFRVYKASKSILSKAFYFETLAFLLATSVIGIYSGSGSVMYTEWIRIFMTNISLFGSMMSFFWYAAYTGLRFKSLEQTLLLIPAFLVIIGMSAWSSIFIHPWLGPLAKWIVDNLVASVFRGIVIGGAIGSIIAGIRTLAGREIAFA